MTVFPAGCANSSEAQKNPQPLTQGPDGWFSSTPNKDETVKIRFDPSYDNGSVQTMICTTRRYAGEYAHELKGESRDPRDVVAESRSMPTGATTNGECWTSYPDIVFGLNNQVDVSTGVGDSIQAPFQNMERYRVTRDAQGKFTVVDMGNLTVDTSKIDTSQANP